MMIRTYGLSLQYKPFKFTTPFMSRHTKVCLLFVPFLVAIGNIESCVFFCLFLRPQADRSCPQANVHIVTSLSPRSPHGHFGAPHWLPALVFVFATIF